MILLVASSLASIISGDF